MVVKKRKKKKEKEDGSSDSLISGFSDICEKLTCLQTLFSAKRHLLSEDVVKLQDFQQKKIAVAHRVSGSKGMHYA